MSIPAQLLKKVRDKSAEIRERFFPSSRPILFKEVLSRELSKIAERRNPEHQPQETADQGSVFQEAHSAKLVGLAFSGGGIRSATFNLGVLQALAKLDILPYIDYLSTVSGGGYIGSWFLAWLKRDEFPHVVKQLNPDWNEHDDHKATPQIDFLRDYSNYLTPQVGALSADVWAAVAVITRNLLLNLAIVISLFIAILLVPRLLTDPALAYSGWKTFLSGSALLVAAFLLFAGHLLKAWIGNRFTKRLPSTQGQILLTVLAPFFVGTYLEVCWLYSNREIKYWGHSHRYLGSWINPSWLHVIIVLGAILVLWVVMGFLIADPRKKWCSWLIWGLALACYLTLAFPAGVWVVNKVFSKWPCECPPYHLMVWGLPAVMAVNLLAAGLQVGLVGLLFRDDLREWTGRLGGWIFILTLAWLALFGIAFYGPLWVICAWGWAGATLTLGWLVHTIAGVLAGFSSRTGKPGAGGGLEILAKTAAPVFVIGLLILMSFGIYSFLSPQDTPTHKAPASVQMTVSWFDDSSAGFASVSSNRKKAPTTHELAADYWKKLRERPLDELLVALVYLAALALAFLLSNRVDINDFSLNRLYCNRLVRCYLGASRPPHYGKDPCKRDPNPFTGFDPKDDFPLAKLAEPRDESDPCDKTYEGPYPLVNAALNLTHGERLAWQERKAESFAFTPLHCGYGFDAEGTYRPTKEYGGPGGVSLGRVVSISGAAASPNMGSHTSPGLAFLMTVFNVRLGQWVANPKKDKWKNPSPRLGLPYLFLELFGMADDKKAYVYLSDGGHFENLGIYELVRRRCRYIIVGDGSGDPDLNFEDLGNAIGKCRTDFGVEINIDVDQIRRDSTTKRSRAHCAVGTITYPERDRNGNAIQGVLVYFKPSLVGDEPTDVLEYAATHPEFPHQSTADQWFEESQFESYRKLGYHVAATALKPATEYEPNLISRKKDEFFTVLKDAWYPPSAAIAKHFTRHAEYYDEIMDRIRRDDALSFLDPELFPDFKSILDQPPPRDSERRSAFYVCNSLIQLMENVYLDLNLEVDSEHPHNRGWIEVFKQWSEAPAFLDAWMLSSTTYGAPFRRFCHRAFHLPFLASPSRPSTDPDFGISASQRQVSITAGQQNPLTLTLTLTPVRMLKGQLTLGCIDRKSQGVTCKVWPEAVLLDGKNPATAALTIEATPNAAKRAYALVASATYATLTRYCLVTVSVQ